MKRLLLNSNEIELGNSSFLSSFQCFDFKDRFVKSSYTNQIKLPKTAKNISSLSGYSVQGSTSLTPLNYITVDYFEESNHIITSGKGILNEHDDYFYLRVFFNNNILIDAIGEDLITDLDYSAFNHTMNSANISGSLLNDSGYIYPILDNGSQDIDAEEWRTPHIYTKTIFELISETYGIQFDSDFLDDNDEFQNEIIPALELPEFSLKAQNTTEYTVGASSPTTLRVVAFDDFLESENATTTNTSFHIAQYSGRYAFKLRVSGTSSSDSNFGFYMQVFKDGFPGANHYVNCQDSATSSTASGVTHYEPYNDVFEFEAFLEVGDLFRFQLFDKWTLDAGSTLELINLDIEGHYETDIDFSQLLPKVSVRDFLVSKFEQYGIFVFPKDRDSLYLKNINEIIEGQNGSVDWTNKLHKVTKTKNKLLSNKVNNLAYADKKIGSDDFTIPSDYLTKEGSFISSKITAVEDDSFYVPNVPVARIDAYDVDLRDVLPDYETNIKKRVLKGSEKFYSLYNWRIELGDLPPETYNIARNSYLYWDQLIDNYEKYIEVVSKPNVKEVILNLNIIDIIKLDLSKIYFFKQLGEYYLLESVSGWENGELCKATLIGTNSSGPVTIEVESGIGAMIIESTFIVG